MARPDTPTTLDPKATVVISGCHGFVALIATHEVADYLKGLLLVGALAVPIGLLMLAWSSI